MRIGVVPEGPLERLLSMFGIIPTPLVVTAWGMGASRCVIVGTKLGVFETLSAGPKTAAEVASETGCDTQAMTTLLDALNGFGFLRRRRGLYRNAKSAKRWLLESSRFSMRDGILFLDDMWDWLGHMEEGVREGKMADLHHGGQPPEFWARYMRGLGMFARLVGPEVARSVRLTRAPRRLLDVGGGHGVYSAAFCRRHPGLQAEVLDLPEAVVHGRAIMAEQGMGDRVAFRTGDLRTDDWGEGYDAVLIFNVIHNVTPDEARDAFGRAYRALEPGGTLVILDSEHTGGERDLSTTGGFNELLFFLTSGTQAYPEETIRGWVTEAGFTHLRLRHLRTMPMEFVLTAQR